VDIISFIPTKVHGFGAAEHEEGRLGSVRDGFSQRDEIGFAGFQQFQIRIQCKSGGNDGDPRNFRILDSGYLQGKERQQS
jgi:hypothetical protein